jgi:hypothetical protein
MRTLFFHRYLQNASSSRSIYSLMFTMLNLSLVQLLDTSYLYIYCPTAVVYNSPHLEECSSGVPGSYVSSFLWNLVPWPKISTLIMEGFTKSNFPPTNWETNYELLRGSPSSSSCLAGSPRDFIFHLHSVAFFILKMGCGHYVW